jgi:hypothetical protein
MQFLARLNANHAPLNSQFYQAIAEKARHKIKSLTPRSTLA